MKTPRFSLPLVVAALALSTPAWPSFVDTFENGVNAGNWDVASGWTDMFYDCGNPGWCFYSSTTDFVPQPKTSLSVPNPFQGNYRAMAVMGVGYLPRNWYRSCWLPASRARSNHRTATAAGGAQLPRDQPVLCRARR